LKPGTSTTSARVLRKNAEQFPAASTDHQGILDEARSRFEDAYTQDYIEREKVVDDLEFAFDPEMQWDQTVKDNRVNRPCFTYNRIEPGIDQIVGDQRKTRMGIKVSPNDSGDRGTAKTLGGLIRNIENISDSETVYDEQFETAVGGGFGAFRIVNDYNNYESFDQDCFIRGIRNPAMQVWFDPAAEEWHKQDGDYMFYTQWISEADFERNFPDFAPASWRTVKEDQYWRQGKMVNVAEYYRKKWQDRNLVQFRDGQVFWMDDIDTIVEQLQSEHGEIANERKVRTYTIEWYKLSAWNVLEGAVEYNWRFFPIVPVWGKRRVLRKREQYKGITRNARDPQKSYNYQRSSVVEAALNTPKTPYLVTSKMIENFKGIWDDLTKKNMPYLPYDPDSKVQGGAPIRQDFQQLPASMLSLSQMDADDIRAVTGIHDPSLGVQQGPQQSGMAISQVQGQGETGSYRFVDNLSKSVQMLGTILVDIIPTIYDTDRTVRIIGEDGAEEFVEINHVTADGLVNDLGAGKYDVAVSVGPTHQTQRQAAGEFLSTVIPSSPLLQDLAMDIVFKYQDIPGAEEIHERLRQHMVSTGRVQPANEEEQAWVPQGPTEEDKLMVRAQLAEIMKTEAETEEKLAKVDQVLADAFYKQMQGEEIATEIDSDAALSDMLTGPAPEPARPTAPRGIPGLPPPNRMQ